MIRFSVLEYHPLLYEQLFTTMDGSSFNYILIKLYRYLFSNMLFCLLQKFNFIIFTLHSNYTNYQSLPTMCPSSIKKDQNDSDSFYNNQQSQEEKKIDTSNKVKITKNKDQPKFKEELDPQTDKKNKSKQKRKSSEKKKKEKKQLLKKAEESAKQIIALVTKAYEDDVKLFQQNKTANRKLLCLEKVIKRLKDVYVAERFLKLGGIILFQRWLINNEETGQQTSLTVKMNLLRFISQLDMQYVQIEDAQDLKKTIMKYKKSRFPDLKKLSMEICQKWNLVKLKKQ